MIVERWPLASVGVVLAVAAGCIARLWSSVLFVVLWGALAYAGAGRRLLRSTPPIDWYLTTSADRVVFSIVLGLATVAPVLAVHAWERMTEPNCRVMRAGAARMNGVSRTRIRAVSDPLFDLSGRVAVVTGGMGQLGAELSVALASRGMRVAILDLATEPRAGAAGLRTCLDEGTIRAHACDVTDREARRGGARARRGGLGRPAPARQRGRDRRPAGRAGVRGRPVRGRPARVRSSASCTSTCSGVVVPCQVIGGAMARAGRGSIVNVGSVYGLLSPDQGLYDFRREAGETFFKPVAYSVSKSALSTSRATSRRTGAAAASASTRSRRTASRTASPSRSSRRSRRGRRSVA